MNWQPVLELMCEGGSIRLLGCNSKGNWLFKTDTDEWALSDEGGGSNQSDMVEGVTAARQLFGCTLSFLEAFPPKLCCP